DLRREVTPAHEPHRTRVDRGCEEDRLELLRRSKREPSDAHPSPNADRIEERLELGDPGLFLFAVLVERRPEELEAVRAERPQERALRDFRVRSEEHTSELQSRGHLVCRLLLEKKKQNESIRGCSENVTTAT